MEAFDDLAATKEKELVELRLQKQQHVTQTIKTLEEELCAVQRCMCKMKGDYEYNLSLLKARDEELAHYEASFSHVKRIINTLVAENSELKVRLDGACKDIEGEKASHLQLQAHHQARLEEIHSRMDSYRRVKQGELDEEREKLEGLQRELRNKLLALEEEGQLQRQSMMADFDGALKKKDHEYQLRLDQFSSSLLEHQSREQHLKRDLAHVQSAAARLEEELQLKCREYQELEKHQKEEAWRLEGEGQRLQDEVHEWTVKYERCLGDMEELRQKFQRKHAELDRAAREKQLLLDAAKQAHVNKECELEAACVELRQHMKQREGEWSQKEEAWSHQEHLLQQAIVAKEQELERLQVKCSSADAAVAQRVGKLEQLLQERDEQLQAEVEKKHEVQSAVREKEKDLQRLVGQLSGLEQRQEEQRAEWEGRVKQAEKMADSRQQELLRQLTSKSGEVEELKGGMADLTITCARLSGDRAAVQELLRDHNIPWPEEASAAHTSEILGLQSRNRELHGIIQQMRAELEQLSDLAEQREKEHEEERRKTEEEKEEVPLPSVNYVAYLEKDVCKLKAEIRQMSERLALASKPPTPSKGLRGSSDAAPGRGVAGVVSSSGKNKQQQQQQQHLGQLAVLTNTIAQLQKHNAELENACKDWKKKHDLLQEKLRDEKEMLYLVKAAQTPQSKLHHKLLQATQVIIALVREKELMSKHVQQLVTGTTPTSSSGDTPKSSDGATPPATHSGIQNALHSSSQPQEKPLTARLELRSEEKDVMNRSAQTDLNLPSGRAFVGGRRLVEVQVKGSGIYGFETKRSGQSQLGRDRTEKSRQPAAMPTELPGKGFFGLSDGSSTARTAPCVGPTDEIRESVSPRVYSPSAHEADFLDQSLPSLQFSESSLEGGAAALNEVLQQVDLALASDGKENWSTATTTTGEETKEPSTGKPVLAMVGREARTHTRPARPTRNGKGWSVSRPNKVPSSMRKPRNYNIKD